MSKRRARSMIQQAQDEPRLFTPPPWRKANGNYSNLIQGPTPRRSYENDDGYRTVASFQSASAEIDSPANAAANGSLIRVAPELFVLADAFVRYARCFRARDEGIQEFASEFIRMIEDVETLPEKFYDEHQAFETGGCGLRRLSGAHGEHDHQDNKGRHDQDR